MNNKENPSVPAPAQTKEIFFAGGCFWAIEKLFQSINGVLDAESGYANGKAQIVPHYYRVCLGDTGYRETVRVLYDPALVTLEQLLAVFFHTIDPTVEKRQGNDIGDQYQTGVYYADKASGETVQAFAEKERKKYPRFAVEIQPLKSFFPAEAYHQNYLDKHPDGYCHIPPHIFQTVNQFIQTLTSPNPGDD
ncbi:MAG: peptide-methionine (S)-S-oxide reductase MsrA [Firmicutes bacterium]|nr:peptide-methionine (S)-S-oxide reductase MsrA [Bacillota bacterium]